MLDDTIVNIIRRRNMDTDDKLRAVKWRQVVASVDWLTSQFKPGSQFQIYMFNNEAQAGHQGQRGRPGSRRTMRPSLTRQSACCAGRHRRTARIRVPRSKCVTACRRHPDNIILLVDSLPTMMESDDQSQDGHRVASESACTDRSIRELPSGIPVNILLFPMEGDFDAAIAYWTLAYGTGGSFMAVSRDWP